MNNNSNSEQQKLEKAKKAIEMQEARKAVRDISTNPDWDLVQELLQEIMATHVIANPEVQPKVPQLITELQEEIKKRYDGDEETKDILLNGIPHARSIREWIKRSEWEEAVWKKISGTGLFTHEKRSAMIQALYTRGLQKNDQAAKMWLTMSGDYSDKLDINDKESALDKFRAINKQIHSKKE